jgi:hypothetical protein
MNKGKLISFAGLLAFLSCLSGWLMSRPSLVGRMGIELFYKEYKFLRTWWQGALAVFVTLMILLVLQGIVYRKLSVRKSNLVQLGMILLALLGFYFTYNDFHHTATHRWLKERFHIGAYLFWASWIMISIYYLIQKRTEEITI